MIGNEGYTAVSKLNEVVDYKSGPILVIAGNRIKCRATGMQTNDDYGDLTGNAFQISVSHDRRDKNEAIHLVIYEGIYRLDLRRLVVARR